MKLIIQIPCLNEEKTLPEVLEDLPTEIPGIDLIETLVIDDGSSDQTVSIAKAMGASHVLSLKTQHGLAYAFSKGLETSLKLGADIIVNTDGDHQYQGRFIAHLVAPILAKKADMVIGCRPIQDISEFTWIKKNLQRIGSRAVRFLSRTSVEDTTSGFRAYSRKAALELHILSRFTYTLETIIQAGLRGMIIRTVPIQVNPKTRESRLFRSTFGYVFRSVLTMVRVFTQYRPLWTYFSAGSCLIGLGLIPSIRFLILVLNGQPEGHIQSLILSAILLLFGGTSLLIGLLADQIAGNRILLDHISLRLKKMEMANQSAFESEVTDLFYSNPNKKIDVRNSWNL